MLAFMTVIALAMNSAQAQSKVKLEGEFDGRRVGGSVAYYKLGDTATFAFRMGQDKKPWQPPEGSSWLWTDIWGRVIKEVAPSEDGKGVSFVLDPVLVRKNYLVLRDKEGKELDRRAFLVVPDMLKDKSAREDVVRAGQKRAALYTWKRCAERTCQVYRECV